jgi:hypothetical protein
MTDQLEHEPHGRHQSKKAAASGWIGSALEYYDFFILCDGRVARIPRTVLPVLTIVSAIAAWSARETYRTHLNDLGTPDAVPVEKAEYERLRNRALALG